MKPIKSTLLAASMLGGLAAMHGPALAQNVLTLNTVQIFGTIDPSRINDYTEYMAGVNLYDALVTVDAGGNITPQLAERWDVSDDARTFTFHLKPDAKFQDGSPVEAKDVVYSLQRLLALNEGPSYLFAGTVETDGVKAVDARTVEFTLNNTYAPFLSTLPILFVINSDVALENTAGDDWASAFIADNPIGAGPYSLKSWERGARMNLTRFEDYHTGWHDGALDELRFIVSTDEATLRAMAANGELTMTSQYSASETYDALAKTDRFKVVEKPGFTAFYMKLNNRVAPTDDVHIRRAIACATDYDTIREVILPGVLLRGPMPEAFGDFVEQGLAEPKFDLQCARDEIAQSKYAGQGKIPIEHAYVAGTKFEEEIALLFKSIMEPLGFDVTLAPEPWNRITERAATIETTPAVTQVFFGPTYPSPDSMFFTQYHSNAVGTWSSMEWVQDPKVDEMIDKGRATADPAEQAEIYKELQRYLVEQQSDVYLLTQTVRHGMDKCLDGFEPVPMQSFAYDFSRYSWTCDN